jgi:outer membrane immunogenic protein
MKIKLLVAAAATVMAGSAMAQSAFEGFYGQIATGYENNSIASTQVSNQWGSFGFNSGSKGSAPLTVGIGYNFTVAPQFVLGLGADYSTISATLNNANITNANPGAQTQTKVSNRYSVYVTPGYQIDKDKLAYLKAGYSNQKVQQNLAGTATPAGAQVGSATTTGGYVVGLGYKQIITGGFYGFAEANYYNYSSVSLNTVADSTLSGNNPKTSAYNFLVGVGYKF